MTPEEFNRVLHNMAQRVARWMPEVANVVVLYNLFDLSDARLGKLLRERMTNAGVDPAGEVERAERVKEKCEVDDAELLDSLKTGDEHMGATVRQAAVQVRELLRAALRAKGEM